MPTLLRSLPLIAFMQLGTVLYAQEADAPAQDDAVTEETAPEDVTTDGATEDAGEDAQADVAGELDLGRNVEDDLSYVKDQYGDWQLQCFRTETGEDPCQMYQLLREEAGNPIAEFSVFRLPGNDQAVAGATLVVPLGTLLSEGLKISVDDGPLKVYNYAFCAIGGCFARVGFTEQDIESFKAGNTAKLTIVPAQAPDQVVEITASLSGFTAAFNEVTVVPN
ncbi:MAG: invasion associated locus B family protein [Pseudomonadota bacterium]